MIKKRMKLIPFILVLMLMLSATGVFASTEKYDLVKEHIFFTEDKDYKEAFSPKEVIKENGKTYKLKDVEYVVLTKKGEKVKTVELKNLDSKKADKSKKFKYKEEKIPFYLNENKTVYEPAKKQAFYVYEAKNPFSFNADSERTLLDQEGKEFTGTLENVVRGNIYNLKVTMPAKFIGDDDVEYFYFANTKSLWKINATAPNWKGYENDILSYLNLDNKIYSISGGEWTGKTTSNGKTTRSANFFGNQKVADYTATYTSGDGELGKYNAKAVYESPYIVKAVASYDESHLVLILTGAGLLVGAGALATILYFLAKRKKEEEVE